MLHALHPHDHVHHVGALVGNQDDIPLLQAAGDFDGVAVVLAQSDLPAFQLAGVNHRGVVGVHGAGAGHQHRVAPVHRVHGDAQGIGHHVALDGGGDVHAGLQFAVVFDDDGDGVAGSAACRGAVDAFVE